MLSVLTTKNKKQPNKNSKGPKKTLGSVGHVYPLDIGDGSVGLCRGAWQATVGLQRVDHDSI